MSKGKSLIATLFCGVVIAAASGTAAFAGEVTGNGKDTGAVEHANSICVFSGKNDDPGSTDPMDPGGVAQSYGYSVVRAGAKALAPTPAEACNGHTGFFAGGGE
jgi:hypothetical protein